MTVSLDPEKQKQAKQYARIRRRLWLLDTILSTLYLVAWLVFGWAADLSAWLRNYTGNEWQLVLGFLGRHHIRILPATTLARTVAMSTPRVMSSAAPQARLRQSS